MIIIGDTGSCTWSCSPNQRLCDTSILSLVGCVPCKPQSPKIAHPTDCTKYFRCINTKWSELDCPASTWYDSNTQRCVRAFYNCPYETGSNYNENLDISFLSSCEAVVVPITPSITPETLNPKANATVTTDNGQTGMFLL